MTSVTGTSCARIGWPLDTFNGATIEWTTHDFDNDGYLDILGGGMLSMNNGDLTFTQTTITPGNGPIGDLNNDGFLDILNGGSAYMNAGNDNNWLKVNCTGTASNLNGIGARVKIQSAMGTQIREIRSGDGFRYMSTLNAHFGIGTDTEVESVTIYWPSGTVDVIENPAINTTLTVVESVSTDLAEGGSPTLNLFPNPTTGSLTLSRARTGTAPAKIFDLTGKQVAEATVLNGRLDVSELARGTYVLQVLVNGERLQERFSKQ